MAELRYNPISREWIMVASHRQARPEMPKNWCPFCPGSGKVPDEGFTVYRYPNDFPALSETPPQPDDVATDMFKVAPAYGRCDVILYSDQHTKNLKDLSDVEMNALSELWQETFIDMTKDEKIKYIYVFENRGEPVGVTMPHPHGQVYGYSFVPKKLEIEAKSATEYYNQHGSDIYGDMLAEELKENRRIIFENDSFVVYVPFYSPITYGVHITAKKQISHMGLMSTEEIHLLGETIKYTAGMYDNLFDTNFPYMMCMHNAPVNGDDFSKSWRFHIEFFPPLRGEKTQQFFASSETGAGAWCNPNSPEEKAVELKKAYEKYIASK